MDVARRDLGALALGAIAAPAAAAGAELKARPDPGLEFAFAATVTLGTPLELGTHGAGRRRFVPITGGTVGGLKIRGEVLAGGGDWQEIGDDGVTDVHARYMLKHADGTIIGVDNAGVRVASPEIIQRLTAGEDLDPALYYFRALTRFEVAAGPHEWLRKNVFVCQGIRHPATVELRFFRVT